MAIGELFGSLIATVASSFCPSVKQLIGTQNILLGISGSFAFCPLFVLADQWFETRKGLVFGIIGRGAGLGGLATAIAMHRQGFSTQIFEQADKFQRLGDSIGFGPNAARLFNRWGVGKRMYEISSKARGIIMHKFDNSEEVIGVDDELSKDEERYGARSMIGHRGDFHMILYDFVTKDLGINVRMG